MLSKLLLFWVWVTFLAGSFVVAGDFSQPIDPQGNLGVGLDFELATDPALPGQDPSKKISRNFAYNTHITFKEPVSAITDNQMVQLALDAYDEIAAVQSQYKMSRKEKIKTPYAMAIIAFESEVIIASSQKGSASYYTDFGDSKVRDTLERCLAIAIQEYGTTNEKHVNGASCGEIMAAHLYYKLYPEKSMQGVRVVAIDRTRQVKNPCGDTEKQLWGCDKFTGASEWHVIPGDIGPEAYDIKTLAGGISKKAVLTLASCSQSST